MTDNTHTVDLIASYEPPCRFLDEGFRAVNLTKKNGGRLSVKSSSSFFNSWQKCTEKTLELSSNNFQVRFSSQNVRISFKMDFFTFDHKLSKYVPNLWNLISQQPQEWEMFVWKFFFSSMWDFQLYGWKNGRKVQNVGVCQPMRESDWPEGGYE